MFPFLIPVKFGVEQFFDRMGCQLQPCNLKNHVLGYVIFLPIVVAYTTWAFVYCRGKITAGTHSSK